jgi:hypothetical protein
MEEAMGGKYEPQKKEGGQDERSLIDHSIGRPFSFSIVADEQ